MKTNRSILSDILIDKKVRKILIAEFHTHVTSKDLITDNMDLFINPNIMQGRKVAIVLEHLSVKEQPKIDKALQERKFLQVANDGQTLRDVFGPLLLQYGRSKEMVKMARLAITQGVYICGGENELSGYSSAATTIYDRIKTGNNAFQKEINALAQDPNTVIIFLGGAAHIGNPYYTSGEKNLEFKSLKTLVNQENDTVSWLVKDAAEISENTQEELESVNESGQKIEMANQIFEFDLVSVKLPEIEKARTAKERNTDHSPVDQINYDDDPSDDYSFSFMQNMSSSAHVIEPDENYTINQNNSLNDSIDGLDKFTFNDDFDRSIFNQCLADLTDSGEREKSQTIILNDRLNRTINELNEFNPFDDDDDARFQHRITTHYDYPFDDAINQPEKGEEPTFSSDSSEKIARKINFGDIDSDSAHSLAETAETSDDDRFNNCSGRFVFFKPEPENKLSDCEKALSDSFTKAGSS